MNTSRVVDRFVCALALAGALATTVSAQAPKGASLYKRLGGYDAIAAVTDDFVPRLASDPQLSKYFAGAGKDTQMRIRQHVVDFICNATGGPCLYTGRPMKTAHAGLGISESDWEVSLRHFVATLDRFKVPTQEKDELLAAVSGLKADIVEKKAM
jgi:hemoglobin